MSSRLSAASLLETIKTRQRKLIETKKNAIYDLIRFKVTQKYEEHDLENGPDVISVTLHGGPTRMYEKGNISSTTTRTSRIARQKVKEELTQCGWSVEDIVEPNTYSDQHIVHQIYTLKL
jgi:hypothetical protein